MKKLKVEETGGGAGAGEGKDAKRDAKRAENGPDSTAGGASPTAAERWQLTETGHDRDSSGMRYIYPVLSRRAGAVSVGINLNPNNACNWACIYCQVPNLRRGGPPPIDLPLLRQELETMLDDIILGDYFLRHVPEGSRRLADVAFSGNGEPTSAREFPAAVKLVGEVLAERGLSGKVALRLITNGSLVRRRAVSDALRQLAQLGGEVWFKVDRATPEAIFAVNGVKRTPEKTLADLLHCASLAPTWVQTCWFAGLDGPTEAETNAYVTLLARASTIVRGVHLYGIARPSMQPVGHALRRLPAEVLGSLARRLEDAGLIVKVSY